MKRMMLIFSLVFWIVSVFFLIFNYTTYLNQRKVRETLNMNFAKEQNNQENISNSIDKAKLEYETLLKEKEKKVKDYEEWKKLNTEIKSYISQN